MIEHNTILYISDGANDSNPLLAALKETGCEVVKAASPAQGVALLYVMHTLTAVVLDERLRERASFDVVQSLTKIRPSVPVMLQCDNEIGGPLSSMERCLSTDKITCELQHLLTEEATL